MKFNPKKPKVSARRFDDQVIKLAIREFDRNRHGKHTGNYKSLLNVHEKIAQRRGE